MRVLVLYAHPVGDSFNAAIHARTVEGLRAAGHEVDDCDLYAERFDPVLSRQERRDYHDVTLNRVRIGRYVDRLMRAEGIVCVFPTWTMGAPAILKGFFDRVMIPGVAFDISEAGKVTPNLQHIRRVAGIVTYGRPRWHVMWCGDPPRKMITRYLRYFVQPRARITYLPYYHMNVATDVRCRRFLDRVGRAMQNF